MELPEINDLKKELLKSRCIGEPGETAPLILENNKLYFERLFNDEKELIKNINIRINRNIIFPEKADQVANFLSRGGLFRSSKEWRLCDGTSDLAVSH